MTTTSDLTDTLVEMQGALYSTPVGVDSEWVRRLAVLLVEARELVAQLEGEDDVAECAVHHRIQEEAI